MQLLASTLAVIAVIASPVFSQQRVCLVWPAKLAGPAAHGVSELLKALSNRNVTVSTSGSLDRADSSLVIVVGLAREPAVAGLVKRCGLRLPTEPESLAIGRVQQEGRSIVVLCGADEVGLMYAALDTTERIGWAERAEAPFAHVETRFESPCLTDRSISTYTMQRKWFERRLYDEEYWKRYFDLLARCRINGFVIVFGYENGGFMAPAYPYFFDVAEFPEVKMYGMTAEQQAKNRAALRRVIELAQERGIRVTLGIWDHIYRGGVQAGGIPGASKLAGTKVPHLVYGLTAANLAPYTKAALEKLLAVFPGVDAIQFRMHWESGLTREETPGFWREVFSTLSRLRPDIRFDLRAKGLPDEVIEEAVRLRLPFRIATKFWMEQLGMPFHPTHVNPQNQRDRRHGYADLLRYPKRYAVHWRIWSGGTARFLLWADPDYVRQFVSAARVYDGRSFEVNEMLATKMLGQPHDEEPFHLHTPSYRHYKYEFERYWHYYQLWGRVSYDPDVSQELWEREFARRFGPRAGLHVMKALHRASKVLPRIVAAAYNYRYFPTTRGWAEMMRFDDLPQYAEGTGTDIEQFQSYRDAARQLLAGQFTTKRSPLQTSRWFERTADRILAEVEASCAAAELKDDAAREFHATVTDLRILAHLARYHAARMKAAVWFNVYLETKDRFALERAAEFESQAIGHWRRIITAAGDVYPPTLKFGVQRVGFPRHWKEELPKLEAGLEELRKRPSRDSLTEPERRRLLQHAVKVSEDPPLEICVERVRRAVPGQDLAVTAAVDSETPLRWVHLCYRHLTQFEDYKTTKMSLDPASGKYVGTIPGSCIAPEWDLMYFVEALPENAPGRTAPDLEQAMPYVIVPVTR